MADNNNEDKNYKYIDYLDEDVEIPGQKWVCISFLSPEDVKNCTLRGLKIRGVYATKEEADKRCKELSDLDPDFHVFAGEVGKWLPWDPEPDSQGEQVYREEELNDLMKGYKENQAKAKKQEAERQHKMKQDMLLEEDNQGTKKEQTRKRLLKKLEKRRQEKSELNVSDEESGEEVVIKKKKRRNRKKKKTTSNINSKNELISKLEEEVKKDSELAKLEGDRLKDLNSTLKEEENKAEEINRNIAKIKTLWSKLKDKKEDDNEENTESTS